MSKPPAFQFYADDFLAGTFSMSNEERGLYITLLCRQWTQGHVTPDEVARLGSTVVQPSINHVLTKFEPDEAGNLRNARLEGERAKQDAFRSKQSEKGKASAKARLNRGSTVVQPSGAPEGNSPSPSPISINTPLPPKGGSKPVKEKGPLQLRAERLMRRRPETPLTSAEERALKKNRAAIVATTESDWITLERFYALPQSETYTRKDLATLLNNWNGEVDRAKAWDAANGPRRVSTPKATALPEPIGWQAYIADDMPTCPYAPGQEKDGCTWHDVSPDHQLAITNAMKDRS